MSSKLNFIPHIKSYDDILTEMEADRIYRLTNRLHTTSFGRPLYLRINVQVVMTHECPYHCPFCLERKHPMTGNDNFEAQIESLKQVMMEHPDARLTITGGEPALYPEHVKRLVKTFHQYGNKVFCSINTSGYSPVINGLAHINLSQNEYVYADPSRFPNCTLQTIVDDPTVEYIKHYMDTHDATSFSFRFLSNIAKKTYPVHIWNELQEDTDIDIHTFRIGDFFVYATFNYNGKHARVTLGDMYVQTHADYKDGYSNIIIHPDGKIGINWT